MKLQQRLHSSGPRLLGRILPVTDWRGGGRAGQGPQRRGGAARDCRYPDSIRGESSELPALPGRGLASR